MNHYLKLEIMIRATERYKNDFNQEIKIDLKNGKIISKRTIRYRNKKTNSNVFEK